MSAEIVNLNNPNNFASGLGLLTAEKTVPLRPAHESRFTEDILALMTNKDRNRGFSDKPLKSKNIISRNYWKQWLKLIHWADHYSCISNIIANALGAFSMLTALPKAAKKKIESAVNFVTTLSYVPYGLSGMNQGIEKKNLFQLIGFAGEVVMPWFGTLKDIYLIRGLDAGINQVWEYCDRNSSGKYKDGYFPGYIEGAKETMSICWKLLKESVLSPISSISPVKYDKVEQKWNFDPSGHNGLISSLLDIISSLGYLATGKEQLFGPLRDLASSLFDFELACQNNTKKRSAGILFIVESTFDFIARYLDSDNTRLFINMLSHAAGRVALMLYKNSDKAAEAIASTDK
ncbi:MAG: hypothetical protein HOA17_06375 [Candidatus Melainabacteria bacterium]|nr:hypothetical protein [Candidatus Melainabacteria bacterium]